MIPNVSMVQVEKVIKFNNILSEFPFSIHTSIMDQHPEASPLYFIVKEVLDFINLRTKTGMLLVQLRGLMVQKTQLKKKIELIRSKFNGCIQ